MIFLLSAPGLLIVRQLFAAAGDMDTAAEREQAGNLPCFEALVAVHGNARGVPWFSAGTTGSFSVLGGYTVRQGSDETSVSHMEHAVAAVREAGVVGNNDEGDTFCAVEGEEELKEAVARGSVEVAGRLVSEHKSRILHEGPRNGYPLLFTAGKFTRPVNQTGGKSEIAEKSAGLLLGRLIAFSADQAGQHDVFESVEFRQQVVELEYETNALVPEPGACGVIHGEDIRSPEQHLTR